MSQTDDREESIAQIAERLAKLARDRGDTEQNPDPNQEPRPEGKLISLGCKKLEARLKLDQNLGCEFPVCVSNRKNVNQEYIEVQTERGTLRMERLATSQLPAPEHYVYWLWFLDRCQAAAERGEREAPLIELNPRELFDLFGRDRTAGDRKKRGTTYAGKHYNDLHEAFCRFSQMVLKQRGALFESGATYRANASLGTLCNYGSWRTEPQKGQEVLTFAKGWIQPGPVLWASIRAGYLKAIPPFKELLPLPYVAQRLLLFLSKHCPVGSKYSISAAKLLPRIPLTTTPDEVRRQLRPHHEALLAMGFLEAVFIEGKGDLERIKFTYQR